MIAPAVAIVSRELKVRRGKAIVRLTCPAGESACTGRTRLVRGGKVLGATQLTLNGGQTKKYKVALERGARRALRDSANDRLRVTLKVTAKDAAGNTGKSSARVTLER